MSEETAPIRKKRRTYHSANARAVAREVIDTLRRGEKVNLKRIILRNGYSESISNSAVQVTETKAYKEEFENYAARLEKHRDKVLKAMESKNLKDEQYRTLVESQTKATHDIQLLTGGKTENVGLEKDKETLKAIVAAIQIDK